MGQEFLDISNLQLYTWAPRESDDETPWVITYFSDGVAWHGATLVRDMGQVLAGHGIREES